MTAPTAPESSLAEPVDALRAALTDYFDGIHLGDEERLARVLHPQVRLFCPTDPQLVELDRSGYLALVAGRPSPASRGDARHDRVVAIAVSSPVTAHARVQCAYLPKLFTDDLTFVLDKGRWQIIAKVWHYELVP